MRAEPRQSSTNESWRTLLTGILQQLLSVPGYFQYNPLAERDVKASVNFLVNNQTFDGNFPCAMGDIKDPRSYR